jgi:hypothetical protein
VTAGTIFDRTRTPLTVWFTACWLFATAKDGTSALGLQRALEFGSYQTAWAMLHRLRSVLVVPGRDRLTGTVEVDETSIGGEEPGLRGGGAKGKKALVAIAVELKDPKGFGRCRMAVIDDGSAASLRPFVTAHVEPGATLITDAWQGYSGISQLGYTHDPRSQRAARTRGQDAALLLPGVHRVASLAKRWLLGTHQGAVDRAHLDSYLTSSCSDSTAATHEAEDWSSTGCSNSLSATIRCVTSTSSPGKGRGRCPPLRQEQRGIRRAWTVLHQTVPGGLPTCATPVKWRARSRQMGRRPPRARADPERHTQPPPT